MPEIGTSGLMSGDGKRGDGLRPQATAPILDSTIPEVGPEEWCVRSCPILAVHPVPDIRRSSGGSDASRVDTSVRGDVVDLAARSTDIH